MSEPEQAEREQMGHPHIFAVNGSSEVLNFIRVLLEGEAYNVTTTNFVPRPSTRLPACNLPSSSSTWPSPSRRAGRYSNGSSTRRSPTGFRW